MMLTKLFDTLQLPGPEISAIAGKAEGTIYGLSVSERSTAKTVWKELRDRRKITGVWPVILGDKYDLAEHRHRLEYHSDADTKAIIRRGHTMDLDHWMEMASLSVLRDVFSFQPFPEKLSTGLDDIFLRPYSDPIYIGLIPFRVGWNAPAYLNFGGWNDCPAPEVHSGLFQRWNRMFSAEVFSITHHEVGLIVNHPPRDLTAAHELRLERFLYCPDYPDRIENDDGYVENILDKPFWSFSWPYPVDQDVSGFTSPDKASVVAQEPNYVQGELFRTDGGHY